jgi:hypothetical protein
MTVQGSCAMDKRGILIEVPGFGTGEMIAPLREFACSRWHEEWFQRMESARATDQPVFDPHRPYHASPTQRLLS